MGDCCSIKEKIVLAIGIGTQMGDSEKAPQIMQMQARATAGWREDVMCSGISFCRQSALPRDAERTQITVLFLSFQGSHI